MGSGIRKAAAGDCPGLHRAGSFSTHQVVQAGVYWCYHFELARLGRCMMTFASPFESGMPETIRKFAVEVLEVEARAVRMVSRAIDERFVRAVEVISACTGAVVTTGVGKAGHI